MEVILININVVLKKDKCCTYVVPKAKNRDEIPLLKIKKPKISLRLLCGRKDSNLHTVRHLILSQACLPIPPRPHFNNILRTYTWLNPKSSVSTNFTTPACVHNLNSYANCGCKYKQDF